MSGNLSSRWHSRFQRYARKNVTNFLPFFGVTVESTFIKAHLLPALRLKHLKQVRQTASRILKRSEHVQPSHRHIKMSHMQKSSAYSTIPRVAQRDAFPGELALDLPLTNCHLSVL